MDPLLALHRHFLEFLKEPLTPWFGGLVTKGKQPISPSSKNRPKRCPSSIETGLKWDSIETRQKRGFPQDVSCGKFPDPFQCRFRRFATLRGFTLSDTEFQSVSIAPILEVSGKSTGGESSPCTGRTTQGDFARMPRQATLNHNSIVYGMFVIILSGQEGLVAWVRLHTLS